MKKYSIKLVLIAIAIAGFGSCQNYDDLELNPNVPNKGKTIPPSYFLGTVLYNFHNDGGTPWSNVHRSNQYTVSNDSYYGGLNTYDWSTTSGLPYSILKDINTMEMQAFKTLNDSVNAYASLSKFLKAYIFVWQTQKVGDIPMSEAGLGLDKLTPKYDSQKEVYKQCLQLLEEANTELTQLIALKDITSTIEGDIYYNNDLVKWQKLINTFKLRVLISLSNRADDTPDLEIKQKFAEVIANPAKYPIMTDNADNLAFKYNEQYNVYPLNPTNGNNNFRNLSSTYLNLTATTKDPRTFVIATPAPEELKNGKSVADFTAYVGSDFSMSISDLSVNSAAGKYSFVNYKRYYATLIGPEPAIIVGYPEMCFNIAEAANRGWITVEAATYYNKGINASLDFYNLTEGAVLEIGDLTGKTLGNVTVSISDFLNHTEVAYKGNNEAGLQQIISQKYIAFFQNSGWEAFYNQRRTGYPTTFKTTGAAFNTVGKLPRRWQYPIDEQTYNTQNYTEAIQNQFGGTDDLYKDIWSVK